MKNTGLLFLLLCALHTEAAPLKLSLNWKPEPQFGGFYEASSTGLFQKAGLEVQIQPGGSGTPTIQMLAAGQTDYAVVSGDELILAHAGGMQDLVAIFATYQTNPQGIMTHAEKNYKNLQDLLKDPKATLLWQAGLPYALYLKKNTPDFKAKTAPYLGGLANFQKDPDIAQQCFVTSEPLMAKKANLKVRTFLIADSGYNPYTTVVVVKASKLQSQPDEVKKMVQTLRTAWGNYLRNPAATNKAMHELNKAMDLATFQASAEAQKPLIETQETKTKGLGFMSETRWQMLADQLKELGVVKKSLQAETLFRNL